MVGGRLGLRAVEAGGIEAARMRSVKRRVPMTVF
jgi:hypothetical protein